MLFRSFYFRHMLLICIDIEILTFFLFDVQDSACTAPRTGVVTAGFVTSNSQLPSITYNQIGVCSVVAGSFTNQMVRVDRQYILTALSLHFFVFYCCFMPHILIKFISQ